MMAVMFDGRSGWFGGQSFDRLHQFDGRIVLEFDVFDVLPARLATYLGLIVEFGEALFVTA
jgi:hypothetical protein